MIEQADADERTSEMTGDMTRDMTDEMTDTVDENSVNELTQHLEAPGSIIVVGAFGRMGGMLLREGTAAGLGMAGLDLPLDHLDPLGRAKVVICCVPAAAMEDTLFKICPRMAKDAVLADITSVKVGPMFQMHNCWEGEYMGTHPLFGPAHPDDEELPIALTRGKRCSDDTCRLMEALFRRMGYAPFETDAETHDKAMARIQNMNFITSLAYCAQTADDETLTQFVTPSFRRRLNAARKLLTEDGAMFAGLYDANPYSMQAVRQFSKLLSLASAGDIDLLLNKARRWWPDAKK